MFLFDFIVNKEGLIMKIKLHKKSMKNLSVDKNSLPIGITRNVVGGTAYTNESVLWWCLPKNESNEVTCTCPTQ